MKVLFLLCAFVGGMFLLVLTVVFCACFVILFWHWLTEQIYLAGLRLRRKGKHP